MLTCFKFWGELYRISEYSLGFKEEVVKGIQVHVTRSGGSSQKACPLPEKNI